MRDSLDEALLRQMEKSILLDTVYDERRISEEAMQALLRERCVEALCAIRRVLDEDTQDPECFGKIEEIVKIYEAIGADGGATSPDQPNASGAKCRCGGGFCSTGGPKRRRGRQYGK